MNLSLQDIFDCSPAGLQQELCSWGEPRWRTEQVIAAAWSGAHDFSSVRSLPLALRRRLNETYRIPKPWAAPQLLRSADRTVKAVFALADGARIESVAIPHLERMTFCLSSQTGCGLGCKFCATAQLGAGRNLTPGEIVGQVRSLSALLGLRPTNLVLMGMGEPLQNIDSVRNALEMLQHPQAWNWSPNRTVVSTSGWLPGLETLISHPLRAKLAFSFNAVDENLRSRLMPINRRYPLKQVWPVLVSAAQATGWPLTLEYILFAGLNDRPEDALNLLRFIGRTEVKVNLIPWNPVPGLPFSAPAEPARKAFAQILRNHAVLTTWRNSRGAEIGAACGQLAGQPSRRAA